MADYWNRRLATRAGFKLLLVSRESRTGCLTYALVEPATLGDVFVPYSHGTPHLFVATDELPVGAIVYTLSYNNFGGSHPCINYVEVDAVGKKRRNLTNNPYDVLVTSSGVVVPGLQVS